MKCLISAVCTVLFVLSTSAVADDWQPVGDKIRSIFAQDVDSQSPLPEYPRPQLERPDWLNLNGFWDYTINPKNSEKADSYTGKILVPFPVESALSGVGKTIGEKERLWYRRQFEVPKNWSGKRIILHFGAVDWEATVFVNGKEVVRHTGGYAPFSADITDTLNAEGIQEITVAVWDPTDTSFQPRGKQVQRPGGIWYTSVTGIWQTVWIEPVEKTHIANLKLTPDIKNSTLTIESDIEGLQPGDMLSASYAESSQQKTVMQEGSVQRIISAGSALKIGASGNAEKPLVVPVANPRLWTPETPVLYDMKVSIVRGGQTIDTVATYFGMREITLGKDADGITRIMLNGKFVFQHGPLDQGWWPDGLYTAPTDKALAYDIEVTKKLGFNMLRKHVKVEPARFYYHCDKLGMLVWQDMPNGDGHIGEKDEDLKRSPESIANYEKEWAEIVKANYNSPCIVVWIPFNEGWGQFDTCRILDWTKKLDPTRLTDGPSGWTDRGCGDMHDMHKYRGPGMFPPEKNRATVLGEYGGLGLPIDGHIWLKTDRNWGYGGNLKDQADLLATYNELNEKMRPMIEQGLSAAVYTQTTDVEVEVNGLMTYDRAIIKVNPEKFKAANDALKSP